MSFQRQRVTGVWTLGTTIDPAELEYWDASIANAIDGAGGGAYALSGDLIIGGDVGVEFQVEIPFTCHDDAVFNDTTAFNDEVFFFGPVSFVDTVGFQDFVTFNENATFEDVASFNGDTFVFGQLSVWDDVYLGPAASLTVDGIAAFNASAVHNAPMTLNAPVALNAPMEVGSGYVTGRLLVVTTAPPAGGVGTQDYDEVHVSAGYSGGTSLLQIKDTGVPDDTRLVLTTQSPAIVSVASGIAGFGVLRNVAGTSGAATNMRRMELWRKSGAWVLTDAVPAVA
jgi:hypothetical protein